MSIRTVLMLGLCLGPCTAAAGSFADSTAELLVWMDADRDGRVALAEYQEYLSRAFRQMDRDRDDVVELDEFPPEVLGPRTRPLPLQRHHANLAVQFERLDLDRDGHLDAIELAQPPLR